ncbi:hypothetical protein PQR71_16030 [Paraburkholderia fungorum]|uniref:hypothetical protein n=1 Tax=Paraburkholderia fungorum TaxID=134537 RepID=UPI0038B86A30
MIPTFNVLLSVTDEARAKFEELRHYARVDARSDFWFEIDKISSRNLKINSEADIENELLTKFPETLKKVFIERLGKSRSELNNVPLDTEGFNFIVRIDGYSSILLSIGAIGLDQFAKFFDHNFDAFEVAAGPFVKIAFERQFSITDTAFLSCVTPSLRALRTPFEQAIFTTVDSEQRNGSTNDSGKVAAQVDSSTLARMKWAWAIAQSTLILPVVLCLLIFYIVAGLFSKEMDAQSKRYEETARERSSLLDLAKAQIDSLSKQNAELGKALASREAGGDGELNSSMVSRRAAPPAVSNAGATQSR